VKLLLLLIVVQVGWLVGWVSSSNQTEAIADSISHEK